MNKYLPVILFIFILSINAQEIDTSRVEHANELDTQVDSLFKVIRRMDRELQQMRQSMVEGKPNVDELIALLNDEDVETVSVDNRSRRKRVDALLKAITQRPGQLRLNGGTTAIMQSGGDGNNRHTTGVGSFDLYAHTSFGPQTLLFFDLEAIGGDGPDQFYPNFAGLNGDAGSTQDNNGIDRIRVLEAWTEFNLLNDILTVTAGKIDLTNYFDNNASANDETMQFISGSFINSSALAVPANAPGVHLRTTFINRYHFEFGLVNSRNSGADLFNDIYKIAGLGFTALPATDFEANFRFYGYQHPLVENSGGWGVSFDKVMLGEYNIFARYGQNEEKMARYWEIKSAWSIGTRFVRQISGQTTALGLAYGQNNPFKKNLQNEQILEFYARRQLNKWTHLSPHLQILWNAAGSKEKLVIIGVRTHFNF